MFVLKVLGVVALVFSIILITIKILVHLLFKEVDKYCDDNYYL